MAATRNRQLVIGLVLALLLLGFVLDRLGYMTSVRALVQTALTPLEGALTTVAQDVSQRVEDTESIETIRTRNVELEALANRLMVENIHLRDGSSVLVINVNLSVCRVGINR